MLYPQTGGKVERPFGTVKSKLRWRFLEGSRVLEVTCGECGTRYLMGHDDALGDTREWAM
jgi:hypothetical protein